MMMKCRDALHNLNEDGYVVLSDYLKGDPMRDFFFEEVKDVIANSRDATYKFGKAERIGSLSDNYQKTVP